MSTKKLILRSVANCLRLSKNVDNGRALSPPISLCPVILVTYKTRRTRRLQDDFQCALCFFPHSLRANALGVIWQRPKSNIDLLRPASLERIGQNRSFRNLQRNPKAVFIVMEPGETMMER
jgi:hypothetical protein